MATATRARFSRPHRGTPGTARRRWLSSAIPSTGRTMCCRYSRVLDAWVIGCDVAPLQTWADKDAQFHNYGAGTGWTGTDLQPFAHKSPAYGDNGVDQALLAGSNGDGLVYMRPGGVWLPATDDYIGQVNEGGSVDPRTAGHQLILFDPDISSRVFLSAPKNSDGTRGIAISLDSGVTWSDWISFATDRNYTAMAKSSLWNAVYASADEKGSGTGGVFVFTGLGSGTGTVQQLDTIGTGKPTSGIPDARWIAAGPDDRVPLAPSPPTGSTSANIPPPRYVQTAPEAAARIAGYIFGDGNEDHADATLGGTALTYLAAAALNTPSMQAEVVRCCGLLGWTAGIQYRVASNTNVIVLKSALTTALGAPASADLYFRGMLDFAPTRLMVQAWLASVIETEATVGTAPDCKVFDDARGGLYDQRIDNVVATCNLPTKGPGGAFRSAISCRVSLGNLDTYALPLIVTSRYPGNSLAPWPEPAAGGPPSGDPGDYLYCFVGTGTDAGIWECVITADPAAGALTNSDVTWRKIMTVAAGDRPQCGVIWQPNGAGTLPLQCFGASYESAANSSGTYVLTAGAGGTTRNYRKGLYRCLDLTVTPTPTWEYMGGVNINMNLYGMPYAFPHPVTYMGEASAENGRLCGSNWGAQDMAISPDGQTVVVVGKTSPYRCDNPWATTPQWRPFSQGLGVLSGEWAAAMSTGDGLMVGDDDRGWFTFPQMRLNPALPNAVGGDDLLGIPSSPNVCASIWASEVTAGRFLAGHVSGKGYRIDTPFTTPPSTAAVAVDFTSIAAASLIGLVDFLDGASALRYAGVMAGAGIVRSAAGGGGAHTLTQAVATSAERAVFKHNGQYQWWCIPDIGIYRSSDYGATWSLWLSHTIGGDSNRWFGHIAQDASDPNTIWFTHDGGGVYRCASAHTAASSTARKVVGGGLAGTETMGLLLIDPTFGDVTAFRAIAATGEVARVYHLAGGDVTDGGTVWNGEWVEELDNEIREAGQMTVAGVARGGFRGAAAQGAGFLRRM